MFRVSRASLQSYRSSIKCADVCLVPYYWLLEVVAVGRPQAHWIKDPVRLFLITSVFFAGRIDCLGTVLVGFELLRDPLIRGLVVVRDGCCLMLVCCSCCFTLVIFYGRRFQVLPKRCKGNDCCCCVRVRPRWWLDQKGGRCREKKDKCEYEWLHDNCCLRAAPVLLARGLQSARGK